MTDDTITIIKTRSGGHTTASPEALSRALRLVPRTGDIVDRRDLTAPDTIVERMARDILAARREGVTGLVDLTEHGWTPAQAMRWGAPARDLAGTPAFATHDVVVRLRESEALAEAAVARAVGIEPAPRTGDMAPTIGGAA